MATKREPSWLLSFQKYSKAAMTSAVPPDLLATIYRLLSGGKFPLARETCSGSVESKMASDTGESIFAAACRELNTSAVREEPPIPSTRIRWMPSLWISSAKALYAGINSFAFNGESSQPIRILTSACPAGSDAHRVGSCAHRRVCTESDSSWLIRFDTAEARGPSEATAVFRRSSIVARSCVKASANDLTPSCSSSWVTISITMPAAFNFSSASRASSRPRVIVTSALP